jgi:hypothetical protein
MWRFVRFWLALSPLLIVAAAPLREASRVVVIDQHWLAQRGPAPHVLDQPDTTYMLATDIRTEGTAFVIDASSVVLDLNGHTIVYGDGKPVAVRNGGFEEGDSRCVPGWNLGQAPAAELAPNTSYLFGKRVLRLKSFRTIQRLVSDPIAVPATSHTHAASITPAGGDYRTALTLTVVDAETGKVLGTGRSANVERGFSAVAHFRPGASRAVRLQVEATPPASRAANLDLDYAMVAASYDYGIMATNAWTGEIPGWGNLLSTLRASGRTVCNFTLKNGGIRQGGARGYGCSPLFFAHVGGLVVDGIQTFTGGMDTITLNAERASGGVLIRGCAFQHDIDNISNRGAQYAVVRLVQVNGPVRVEANRLLGVPLVGVLLDGGRQTRIVGNEIRQRAVAVNGYGIIVSASRDFEIAKNRIVAENGRGILLDGYRKEPLEGGAIHDNYVEVRERLNREYHTRIEARALRMRAGDIGPHRNLHIHHNTFVAMTGPGLAQKAFAVRIGYTNRDGQMDRANLRVEHNTMRAITMSGEPGYRASALALDGLAPGVDLCIRENVLESNDSSITLADTEGPAAGVRLVGNTFRQSTKGARRPYVAIHAGYWNFPVRAVEFLDPRLESGATLAVRWAGSGTKDLSIAYLLTVTARKGGTPIPNALVSVRDNQGREVFAGKTDARGEVRDIPVIDTRYRQDTEDPKQITTDHRGPFSVLVTSESTLISRKFVLGANQSVSIDLPPAVRER